MRLDFDTHHPQAMEVVGDRIYLSSVEIIEPTVKYPTPVDGYDRTPGKGVGHLFVLDSDGTLLEDIILGEGNSYHPGGLDVDGEDIWIPVAEYRPDSAAIIYRVDADTFEVEEQFTVDDHVGGVVMDQRSGRLVGQSWGSRRFYEWTTRGQERDSWLNDSHFVDYRTASTSPPARRSARGSPDFRPSRVRQPAMSWVASHCSTWTTTRSCMRCRPSCGRPPATS